MDESKGYMKIKAVVGANNNYICIYIHYIGVRNAIYMKGVQQLTIELNGPHGPLH